MSWDSSSRKPEPCRCPCLNSSFYVLCSTKYLQPAPVKEMNDRGLLLQPSSLGLAPLAISRRPACLSSTLVTYHSPGVGSPMNIYAEEPPPYINHISGVPSPSTSWPPLQGLRCNLLQPTRTAPHSLEHYCLLFRTFVLQSLSLFSSSVSFLHLAVARYCIVVQLLSLVLLAPCLEEVAEKDKQLVVVAVAQLAHCTIPS